MATEPLAGRVFACILDHALCLPCIAAKVDDTEAAVAECIRRVRSTILIAAAPATRCSGCRQVRETFKVGEK